VTAIEVTVVAIQAVALMALVPLLRTRPS